MLQSQSLDSLRDTFSFLSVRRASFPLLDSTEMAVPGASVAKNKKCGSSMTETAADVWTKRLVADDM